MNESKKKNEIHIMGASFDPKSFNPKTFDPKSIHSSKFVSTILLIPCFLVTLSLLIEEINNSLVLYSDGTLHKVESATFLKTYKNYEGYKDRIHVYEFLLSDGNKVRIALSNKIENNPKIRYLVWLKGTEIGAYSESEPALLEYLGGRDAISNIVFLSVLSLFWLGCALYVFKKKESLYPNQELRHVF